MISRIILGTTLAFISTSPSFAGPCTQRIADLEKSVSARQEGAGPTLDAPATTGSAVQGSSPAGQATTTRSQSNNQTMQMIQQAKQLDQQGKEAECMDMTTRIGAMAPPATK
ncbi:hypothetical protein [Microvirga calopogonii]|uniref:hypothetical protein n=1 Tax=Microvirga calopogonii TaxID=2078013 RepID=UPI000E0CD75B|nr:hypothetical protein [Microvirga calopogonii]